MMTAHRWEQPLVASFRLLIWLLTLGLLGAGVWAGLARVSVYAVVRGTLMPSTPPIQVNVPVSGRVLSTEVQLWQHVKKGQVLLTLSALGRDPQDAALQLTIQRSAAAQSREDISAAEIELATRLKVARQKQEIYALGGLPQMELEAAQSAVETTRSALSKARSQLASAQAQLELLGRSQKVMVRSPIDGQVMTLSDVHPGQVLGSGASALQLLPEGVPLVFHGDAAEQDRPKLRQGSRVQVAWNSYPRQKYGVSNGTLSEVAPTSQADAAGRISYQIEVALPTQTGKPLSIAAHPLSPGLAGEAHVLSGDKTVLNLFWDWLRGADPWS